MPTPENNQEPQDVAFGLAEAGAKHRGAHIEITPPIGNEQLTPIQNWQDHQNDGFEEFRQMLQELQKIKPNWSVKCFRGSQIIGERYKPIPRPYLVVQILELSGFGFWILEFQQKNSSVKANAKSNPPASSKNHGISTLILKNVSKNNNMDQVISVIHYVLENCLLSGYHWNNNQLDNVKTMNVYLVKHSQNKPDAWAQRILNVN